MEAEPTIGKERVAHHEEKPACCGEPGSVMARGLGWCAKRTACGLRRHDAKCGGIDDDRNFQSRRQRGPQPEDDGKRDNGENNEWTFMRTKACIAAERINIGAMRDEETDQPAMK